MKQRLKPICILGGIFDTLTIDELVSTIRECTLSKSSLFISTINLNYLRIAHSNLKFKRTLFRSNVCTIDGGPIASLLRIYGIKDSRRVTGADLFEKIIRTDFCIGRPFRIYIFGGSMDSAVLAKNAINSVGSFVECVGAKNPGYGSISDMSTPDILAEINEAKPDLLVVSLGAKKGQLWIDKNLPSIASCTVCHLGAAINFVSGTILRAPKYFQNFGIEWIWRIKQEPILFRRYLLDAKHLMFRLAPMLLRSFLYERILSYPYSNKPSSDPKISFDRSNCKAYASGDWTQQTINREFNPPDLPTHVKTTIYLDGIGKLDGHGLGTLLRWSSQDNAVLSAMDPIQVNRKLKLYGVSNLLTNDHLLE